MTADTPGVSTATAAVPYFDARETHTAMVVFAGDRAYKVKKPVLTDFVDFRTAAQRERACRREVELNSRLSPGSYLGVAQLTDPTGGPAEPIVVMRRYSDQDRLASMVTRGESVEGVLDRVAEVLADFHRNALRGESIDAQGEAGAVGKRWRDNLWELHRYAETIPGVTEESIDRIERLATEYISGRAHLFAHRIDERCVVDGHGDLLADDIFVVDGEPALLDCMEFDDQLRYVDQIDDAAFLAMDLEFLGRRDLGDHFMERYIAYSGDESASSLRHFYIAYRAVVRAKVECVRVTQGGSAAAADAVRHLGLATGHLQAGAVRLALVGGNPGTGKSTVARALAEQVGAQVISTDNVRRELLETGIISGEPGVLDSGLYSPDNVATVYEIVLRRARMCLDHGRSVILDGTWRHPHWRAEARRIATETHSQPVEIMCAAGIDMTADRIVTRPAGNSDATPEIAAALAARPSGWDEAFRIDTSQPLATSAEQAVEVWRKAV